MNFLVFQVPESAGISIDNSLARAGFNMITVASGAAAFVSHRDADLVLLDLDSELSEADHLEIYRMIRKHGDIPIIAFSRQKTEPDGRLKTESSVSSRVDAPVAFQELLARLVGLPRRAKTEASAGARDDILHRGDLRIDLKTREVHVGKRQIKLTRKEFDLLYYLASRPKRVVSRQQLMADIWGDSTAHALVSRNTRTIDTHVNSLRSKLGCRSWVETVRGIGFRFVL